MPIYSYIIYNEILWSLFIIDSNITVCFLRDYPSNYEMILMIFLYVRNWFGAYNKHFGLGKLQLQVLSDDYIESYSRYYFLINKLTIRSEIILCNNNIIQNRFAH